jgi:membrane protease YdiL (CAAX protease family)
VKVARIVVVYLLWNLAVSAALLLAPPPWSAVAVLLLFWLIVDGMLPGPQARDWPRRAARLRLRPLPRGAWAPVAAAAALSWVFATALTVVWGGMVSLEEGSLNPFGPLMATPGSRLAVTLYVVAVAPLVEELVFRGVVQRAWERRLGAAAGLVLTAALFAGMHGLPRAFPLLFALGLTFGWVVRLTRSLWPAVALHAANNLAGIVGMRLFPDPEAQPTLWEAPPTPEWWTALAVAAGCAAAAVPLARLLRRTARAPAPPPT